MMLLSSPPFAILTFFQLIACLVFAENGRKNQVRRRTKEENPTSSSLVALIEKINTDASPLLGTGTIHYNSDGSFLFSLDMVGLTISSEGTAVITEGTSCDETSGDFVNVPYVTGNGFARGTWQALGEGISRSAFRLNNGYTSVENMGKSVLLYAGEDSETPIGCGILGEVETSKILVADIGTYPGYTDGLMPEGKVTVTFNDDNTFTFHYEISGLASNCVDCGIHIHAGTSCATDEEVLGHGWNSVIVQDLWTTAGGSIYTSDSNGDSDGYFSLFNGFGYEENYNHAVVTHTQDGTRVGCGILK